MHDCGESKGLHATCRRTAREFACQHGPNAAIAIRGTQELGMCGATGVAEPAIRIPSPGVRCLFIGKSSAILLGFPDTTQDADLFVERSPGNGEALVAAIRELGFNLSDAQATEIVRGKDFVQLKNGPFDLDLVFAPDGIERFSDAWARRVDVEGFPMCHPDDIIASKAATNRVKDRESLPRLRAFRDYWANRPRG